MKMPVVGISIPISIISTLLMPTWMLVASLTPPQDEPKKTNEGHHQIELIGVGAISGSQTDKSGLTEPLVIQFENDQEDPHPVANNMLGGFSAAEYSGSGNTFYFLSDRGPFDGAVDWQCRIQTFEMVLDDSFGKPQLKIEHVATTCLIDDSGKPFTGLASAFNGNSTHAARLDPEGLRIDESGNFFITDEYGPRFIKFSPTGEMICEFKMPEHLLIDAPGLTKADENPLNQSGRQTNRGMEGLAIAGNQWFGLMQSPLLQDSYRALITDKPTGMNCRLQQFSDKGVLQKEYLYRLDEASNKLNEILATGPSQFLVIERDGEAGELAKFKKLMLVSTRSATDIAGVDALPAFEEAPGVQPIQKTVLIDLLDPKWNLAGEKMPEKIESLTFGPDLDDGRRMLVVTSDNDFEADKPTYVYVFAIPPSAFRDALR